MLHTYFLNFFFIFLFWHEDYVNLALCRLGLWQLSRKRRNCPSLLLLFSFGSLTTKQSHHNIPPFQYLIDHTLHNKYNHFFFHVIKVNRNHSNLIEITNQFLTICHLEIYIFTANLQKLSNSRYVLFIVPYFNFFTRSQTFYIVLFKLPFSLNRDRTSLRN